MNTISVINAVDTQERLRLAWLLSARGSPLRGYEIALEENDAARRNPDVTRIAESADCLADCCIKTAQYELGISFARTAGALWHALGEKVREAGATSRLAQLLAAVGDPDSITQAEHALALAEQSGDVVERIRASEANGIVLSLLKQPDLGLPFSERAVALARTTRTSFPVAIVNLAEVIVCTGRQAMQRGDRGALAGAVDRGLALTREALAEARALGDGWLERLALNNIAEYSLHLGDTQTASAALADYGGTPGEPTLRCQSHHLLISGQVMAADGRLREAVAAFESCRVAWQATFYIELATPCLESLAAALEGLGEYRQALAVYREFHDYHVRSASEAAQRRARVYALRQELEKLRADATESQLLAANLTASNAVLEREAERLRRSSLEDPLTGLANRRRLEVEFGMLGRSFEQYAIAMIDIDHFKSVNDTYSHQMGDTVLQNVARLLAANARTGDLVTRYGGEEFALLMHDTESTQAGMVCERLRGSVEDHDWTGIARNLSLTVSIGLATSSEGADRSAVMKKADARLYRAKRLGRNRVIMDEHAADTANSARRSLSPRDIR